MMGEPVILVAQGCGITFGPADLAKVGCGDYRDGQNLNRLRNSDAPTSAAIR